MKIGIEHDLFLYQEGGGEQEKKVLSNNKIDN